ncbi:MAG: hypothetical protein LBI08_02875 [Methanomassiliicoccaceae archaeon]|jgi:hypothetical protein|nr:hypothetical protein [Methanomassiliicoccaceae archaeon]
MLYFNYFVCIEPIIGDHIANEYDRDICAEKDRVITKAVPYIALVSALTGLLLAYIAHSDEMGLLLLRFCSPFVLGFALLGVYAFIRREEGALNGKVTLIIFLTAPMIISLTMIAVTSYIMPEIIDYMLEITGNRADKNVTVIVILYSLTVLMTFASHGVISTVVAYFRRYTARIYLSLEKIKNDHTDSRRNRISRWVYSVPDVIDVQRIELEPAADNNMFPKKMFSSLAFSIFALGLSISSYIFLNPIFQSALTIDEAVIITVILTFFMPVLVIPWFITRDIGAKIKSQARDYYLWKGMRKRLYQGFFAIMVFLSMLAISLYLGYDIVRTSYTYAGYVLITAFLSVLYAFIYANYYHKGFKEGIIQDFNEAKR